MATALTASPVGLVEAAEDPRLFGLKLSERQRDLLATIEANHTVVACCGRQSGKTLLCAVTATANLLLRADLDEQAGRSARHVVSIANARDQASILLAFVAEFCQRSVLLRKRIVSQAADRIVFTGGRVLVAAPCQDRLVRGVRSSLIVLDEAGHFVNATEGPRVGERIYAALRPSLVTLGEQGKALIVSTPGEAEFFTRLHVQAAAGELPGAAAFSARTEAMNPKVDPSFLAGERIALGEADYLREYEGQFVAGASAFLDAEDLAQVVGRYAELHPDDVSEAVVGFDPAFAGDPAAAVVVGRSRADRKRLLVCRVERWAPKRSRAQRRAAKTAAEVEAVRDVVLDGVADLARAYRAVVVTDQHLSRTVVDGLRERGVERVHVQAWTGKLLTQAFTALRARVIANTIELPRDDTLVTELTKIRSRSRGGSSTVEIPRSASSHLDSALALAAAVLRIEAKTSGRPARTLSSFGPGFISERVVEEILSRPPVMGMR